MMHTSSLKILAAALSVAASLAAGAGVPAAPQALHAAIGTQTDRLIVKYKDAVASGKVAARMPAMSLQRKAIIERTGQQFGLSLKLLRTIATGAHVFQLGRKMALADVAAVAAELMARDPSVEYAEPDRIMTAAMTPNDPLYTNQWNYFDAAAGLRLPGAWDKSTGAGINVAVVDTGYRPHVDLQGQILQGYDLISSSFTANDGDGRDGDASDPGNATVAGECGDGLPSQDESSSWHGTHVAGTIAALTGNGMGVAGVAFGAKIVPARVLGKCGGYTSDIADGIFWAAGGALTDVPDNANQARVINASLGGPGPCDATTQSAIDSARSRGTVVVVSAGNSHDDASNYSPANCAGVIAVAAVGITGGQASYSNFGAIVDVAAPGGDSDASILSTLNAGTTAPASDNYAYSMGTSMAAPHVAGVAALMLSKNPYLTPDEIEGKLKATARAFPADCPACGTGIVDAQAAVDAAMATMPTQDEVESNDTPDLADVVANRGTLVNGSMGTRTDGDFFLVPLPPGATLTAMLTMAGATSDYDLVVYDGAGALLGASRNEAGLIDAVSTANTTSATVARYVRVFYYSGDTGSSSGKYALKLGW